MDLVRCPELKKIVPGFHPKRVAGDSNMASTINTDGPYKQPV